MWKNFIKKQVTESHISEISQGLVNSNDFQL